MIRNKLSENEITSANYHRALHASYRVWMMTPQGDSARLVEYEANQEGLEELLEDYTRYADLVVRIEVLDAVESTEPPPPGPEDREEGDAS